VGIWLRPQKMNQKFGKILIQETLNWDSTMFVSTCKVTAINNMCVCGLLSAVSPYFSVHYT